MTAPRRTGADHPHDQGRDSSGHSRVSAQLVTCPTDVCRIPATSPAARGPGRPRHTCSQPGAHSQGSGQDDFPKLRPGEVIDANRPPSLSIGGRQRSSELQPDSRELRSSALSAAPALGLVTAGVLRVPRLAYRLSVRGATAGAVTA